MKKLFGIVLFSVVGILLISGVGVTIIDDVSDNIVSQENNISERYFIKTNNMDLVLEHVAGNVYMANNEEIEVNAYTAVVCDDLIIQFSGDNGGYLIRASNMQTSGAVIMPANNTTIFTVTDGAYSYNYDGLTLTGTTETLLYPSERGNYGSYSTFTGATFNVSIGDSVYAIAQRSNPYMAVIEIVDGVKTDYIVNPCTSSGAYTETAGSTITATLSEDGKSYVYTNVVFTSADVENKAVTCFAPVWYDVVDTSAQAVRDIVGVIPIILILILIVGVAYGLMSYVKGGRSEL